MKHFLLLLFALTATTLSAKPREIRFKILETTDLHGHSEPSRLRFSAQLYAV